MSKDPSFPFYSQDFLVGTFAMDDATIGKYIKLLAFQHQSGHLSEKTILKVCGGEMDPELKTKFKIDNEGLYYNERLDEVLENREKFKAKQSDNANQRWSKTNAKSIPNECQTNTKSMPLENENEIENEIEYKEEKVPFEIFWNLYDKKIDRKKCEVKWNKLTDEEKTKCIEKLPDYIQATPDKKFRRDPETYLNNKSWENEIIKAESNSMIPAFQISDEDLRLLKNSGVYGK